MLKPLAPARLLCLAFLTLAALLAPTAQAQRLGGLPDPAFHPADSGLAVPSLNRKNQIYFPAPEGGLYMSTYSTPAKYDTRGRHHYHFTSYYNKSGASNYYNTNSFISSLQGFLMQATPNQLYLAQEGSGGYQQSADSIRIVPYRPLQLILSLARTRAFYFNKPFRGYSSQGVTLVSPTRLAFFTTHNPLDTAAPVNTTYVRLIDTSGTPTATVTSLANFRAEAISSDNGKIYLLGYDMVDDTVQGSSRVRVLSATSLAQMAGPAVDANLLAGKPRIFQALPGGKLLVAGLLFYAPFGITANMAQRLLPTGDPDPAYNMPMASGNYTAWHQMPDGTLRAASSSSTGFGGNAILQSYNADGFPSGGSAIVALDPSFPTPHPLCFQPDLNAFLFETHDLSPNLSPQYWSGYLQDTSYAARHRFYVGYNRKVWPLVNHHGVGMYQDYFTFNSNPVRNQILATGTFTQVNRELRPIIALINADGTTDTTFKAVHKMDEPMRSQLLYAGFPEAKLTNSGKVIFNYPNGYWNYYNGGISDSLHRLSANGNVDASYTRVWAPGTVIPRKRGGYATIRPYDNAGLPTTLPAQAFDTEIRLVKLDADGNLMGELGSFKATGFPDTVLPNTDRRWRDAYTEDEEGGVWMLQGWVASIAGTNPQEWRSRQYYVRFDTNGRSRIINPNFSIYEKPLKIEILAGKRMRLTGAFNIPNGTLAGSFYNIIETDSTGILDTSVAKVRYFLPDSYGARTNMYVVPRKYMPDGKMITALSTGSGYFNMIMRHFPDGRQDPSFLPINMAIMQTGNLEVLGDRLYLGGENYGWLRVNRNGGLRYLYGGSIKNGLHAYRISSMPGTVGYVQGRVQQVVSPATGCNPTAARRPATGMIVKASPSARLAVADTGGYYFLALDTGRYDVSQTIANNFLQRQVCPPATGAGQAPPPRTAHLRRAGSTLVGQDFINQTFDCPRLEVTVLQPRFRLCSRSTIKLQYQNDGMADEPSARVRLNLPEEIRIETSSHAYTRGADSSFVFDLGRLRPGQHGEIVLRDTIGCPAQPDSLARACYSARIEPLSLCSRIDPTTLNWDGAWLDAEARYQQARDIVRLVIRNRGNSMADSTPMRLVNTHSALYFDGKIKLAAGDSLVFETPPAIQGSISLAVQQTANCPLGSRSALFHAGRGTARTFLHFGSGLLESYTVQACPSFRFSYDPNEKLVQPEGEIEPGTLLSYTIHFENFGNDTAYSVIVEDSLPAGLDVSTLKMTSSSTPCKLELTGTEAQPVAYFHFNPIKLTGKKQDSVRSKGQVSFNISTRPSVARGSVISNRANIYFDRNAAVVTDYINSPIANPQLLSAQPKTEPGNTLTLYPNPTQGTFQVRLNSASTAGLNVTVTTLQGQVIYNRPLPKDGTLRLQGTRPGIYLVKASGHKAQRLIIVR